MNDLLKEKINILDIVQKYVKLKKAGKYFTGLCPFHKETKPSFYVSEELQIFKCFGCGEGGDVIKFLMKIENSSYQNVLEKLKEEYGLEVKIEIKNNAQEKKILEINYAALKFFRKNLKENNEVLEYLKSRGLNETIVNEFELGFSPGNTLLRDHLYALGYSLKEIQVAGLLDNNNFDRFQSRIIFPLRNEKGKLIGFTGRLFKADIIAENKKVGPKYLNSPETLIFKKSQFLYGLFYSKEYILQNKKAILVEGQFDFLLSWQNNIKNIVAISGSALTEDHLRKLKRYCQKVVFAFDNDEAGFRASLKANLLAQKIGFQTYQLIYQGKDLGEFFLKENNRNTNKSIPHQNLNLEEEKFEDYLLNVLIQKYSQQQIEKSTIQNYQNVILEIFLPQIKNLKLLEITKYLDKLSSTLNIPKNILEKELEQLPQFSDWAQTDTENTPTDLLIEENTLEEKFALKLLSLLYLQIYDNHQQELTFSYQELEKYLPLKLKAVSKKLLTNELDEKEKEYFEFVKQAIDLKEKKKIEKEITKTFHNLKKIILKKNLKNLQDQLKITSGPNYDKIVLEINTILKELKQIDKIK